MTETSIRSLRVPGATLHVQSVGAGPVLLVLQGGAADADGSTELARHLADRFTVVSYDRRGLSRSVVDDAAAPVTLATHADDARAVLGAFAETEPAFVLGISIGALTGLDLVARHPEAVRGLVAHEPPASDLLPAGERERLLAFQSRLEDVHRTQGTMAAMRLFMTDLGVAAQDREPDAAPARPSPHTVRNLERFLAVDAPAVHAYRVPTEALRRVAAKVVPAKGETSGDALPAAAAVALGGLLGREVVAFPGGHGGYASHPRAFATRLAATLAGWNDALS